MRKKKAATITAAVIIVIGAILYGLAKRYLIEQVEVDLGEIEQTTEQNDADASAPDTSSELVYDDRNYKDGNIEIHIEEVEKGSGQDKITYYVANVVVKDSSFLMTAFAKNQFGLNIIENTSAIASDHDAVFAINGDYYGFRSDGVVIRNGVLFRDEPARDALAMFKDGTFQTYNENEISSAELLAQGVTNTFSFGPVLVKNGEAIDDFESVKIDKNFGNRSIQNANPRTGIGIIGPNHYVFVVVDGRSSGYSRGMTLNEFAQLFEELGSTDAYNLDGGGSSTMYFMGKVVNNPLGKQKERGVSDIIYIGY